MALTVDSNGTVVSQQELARIRAEALATPAVAPVPAPVPRPIVSEPIELPATIDRRPPPESVAPAPADTLPARDEPAVQGGAEELDAVYTANGGQLGDVVDGGARVVGILPGPEQFLPTLPGASTPESRLAGDGLNASRGGAASGLFTAAQGIASQGAVDSVDVAAAVIAQGIDDAVAGVSRTQVAGTIVKGVAKLGPVAAVSTIVANVNAAIQEGGTRESIVQATTHAGLDLAALGGAALAGTAIGGPLGAVAAVAGFTAYQLVGPQVKEFATDAVNGTIDWVGGLFS